MSDNKIKIFFIYPEVNNVEQAISRLKIADLPFTKNFVWDDENPDYIIATDYVYMLPERARKFRELLYNEPNGNGNFPIIISLGDEAIFPDLNIFDYAVCWNWNFSYGDRVVRIPSILGTFTWESQNKKYNDLTLRDTKSLIQDKKRFCCFIHSASGAGTNPYRDKLFHALSQYKRVESLGSHMNNVGTLITQGGGGKI